MVQFINSSKELFCHCQRFWYWFCCLMVCDRDIVIFLFCWRRSLSARDRCFNPWIIPLALSRTIIILKPSFLAVLIKKVVPKPSVFDEILVMFKPIFRFIRFLGNPITPAIKYKCWLGFLEADKEPSRIFFPLNWIELQIRSSSFFFKEIFTFDE